MTWLWIAWGLFVYLFFGALRMYLDPTLADRRGVLAPSMMRLLLVAFACCVFLFSMDIMGISYSWR